MLDRLVAAAAAMSSALYFMAGLTAWIRWASPRANKETFVKKVILDRAIAWSALSVLFAYIALLELEMVKVADIGFALPVLVALIAIYLCGLLSIRAITVPRYGYKAVLLFGSISFVFGLIIFFI